VYRINDKVIFSVDWMRAPVLGYIDQISGSMCRCRLAVPLMGRTHAEVRIDALKPSQDLIDQREKERSARYTVEAPNMTNKTIDQMVKEIASAKKIRI